jgi:hypothetical protein
MSNAERHNAEHNQSSRTRTSRRKDVLFALVVMAVFVVLVLAILVFLMDYGSREAALRSSQRSLNNEIAAVKPGQAACVHLYCSVGTDALLEQLVDVPEIESVWLEMTDVTDAGMKSLAALKNLRSLQIDGGRAELGNEGLSQLRTMSSLKRLTIYKKISNSAMKELRKALPNCAINESPTPEGVEQKKGR